MFSCMSCVFVRACVCMCVCTRARARATCVHSRPASKLQWLVEAGVLQEGVKTVVRPLSAVRVFI